MDTLGKFNEHDSPGLYQCHGSGGNQEWIYSKKRGFLKHARTNYCLGLDENEKLKNFLCTKVYFYI